MFFNHKIIIILIVIFLCLFLKTKFTETFKIKDSNIIPSITCTFGNREKKIYIKKGPNGPLGPSGIQGPIGPEGPIGPRGPTSTITGPTGITGPIGNDGSPIRGIKGMDGETGFDGAQGAQGPKGAKGSKGEESYDYWNPISANNILTDPPDLHGKDICRNDIPNDNVPLVSNAGSAKTFRFFKQLENGSLEGRYAFPRFGATINLDLNQTRTYPRRINCLKPIDLEVLHDKMNYMITTTIVVGPHNVTNANNWIKTVNINPDIGIPVIAYPKSIKVNLNEDGSNNPDNIWFRPLHTEIVKVSDTNYQLKVFVIPTVHRLFGCVEKPITGRPNNSLFSWSENLEIQIRCLSPYGNSTLVDINNLDQLNNPLLFSMGGQNSNYPYSETTTDANVGGKAGEALIENIYPRFTDGSHTAIKLISVFPVPSFEEILNYNLDQLRSLLPNINTTTSNSITRCGNFNSPLNVRQKKILRYLTVMEQSWRTDNTPNWRAEILDSLPAQINRTDGFRDADWDGGNYHLRLKCGFKQLDDINTDWQYKYGFHAVRYSSDPSSPSDKYGEGIKYGPVVSYGQIHSLNNPNSTITPIKLQFIGHILNKANDAYINTLFPST